MKKHAWLIFTVFLIQWSNVYAYWGNRAGSATFTVGAGYDFFSSKRNIENASIPLVILGYNFTNCWGIEGLLGNFNTDFKPSANNDRSIRGTLVLIDAVYHFPLKMPLQVFALAGVGILGLDHTVSDAHNEGNMNVGFGLNYIINSAVGFRVEARDLYTFVEHKNDILFDAGVTFFLDLC